MDGLELSRMDVMYECRHVFMTLISKLERKNAGGQKGRESLLYIV
jgi:hypothetical protein